MTYCVAASLNAGIVFCSDSRTNAGIDQVSTYSKMHRFGNDGDRQFVILSSGNLATTQGVISIIKKDIKNNSTVNLFNVVDLDEAADYIGEISVAQQKKHYDENDGVNHEANFIIGGQVGDKTPGIALVYPQGNHITSSKSTPYLQIGESKYGKPILDRILSQETSLDTAALCILVSMDSTIRSNLTVGPPIEVLVYETDSLVAKRHYVFDEDSDYLRQLTKTWDSKLKEAFRQIPPIVWSASWDQSRNEQNEA